MYLPKNIINLIFSFDPTYKELYDLVMQDIINIVPSYDIPCMYKVKDTKEFLSFIRKFKTIK